MNESFALDTVAELNEMLSGYQYLAGSKFEYAKKASEFAVQVMDELHRRALVEDGFRMEEYYANDTTEDLIEELKFYLAAIQKRVAVKLSTKAVVQLANELKRRAQ